MKHNGASVKVPIRWSIVSEYSRFTCNFQNKHFCYVHKRWNKWEAILAEQTKYSHRT